MDTLPGAELAVGNYLALFANLNHLPQATTIETADLQLTDFSVIFDEISEQIIEQTNDAVEAFRIPIEQNNLEQAAIIDLDQPSLYQFNPIDRLEFVPLNTAAIAVDRQDLPPTTELVPEARPDSQTIVQTRQVITALPQPQIPATQEISPQTEITPKEQIPIVATSTEVITVNQPTFPPPLTVLSQPAALDTGENSLTLTATEFDVEQKPLVMAAPVLAEKQDIMNKAKPPVMPIVTNDAPTMTVTSREMATPVTTTTVTTAVTEPQFAEDFSEKIQWMVNQKINKADIQIHPRELGPIKVEINLQHNKVDVQVTTVNASTQEIMEKHLPQLRELFSQQSLQLDEVNVNTASQQQQRDFSENKSFEQFNFVNESEESVVSKITPLITTDGQVDAYV